MRRSILCGSFLVAAIVAGLTVGGALAAAGVRQAPRDDSLDGILGFELGEERRYISGPRGALRNDGEATWSIRLDQVVDNDDRKVGVFSMTHEQRRNALAISGGMTAHWRYEGELLINEHGFPEGLRYSWFEEHTGEAPWKGDAVFSSYVFEDGRFQKVVRLPDQDWEFSIPIANHGDLDLDVPSGMYLFRPSPADIDFFTNPALLEFALPALLDASWERRTLFFKPTIPARYPSMNWIRAERNGRRSLDRNYDKITLSAGEETTLSIGGRTLNVRRLSISGPMRDAYVDEFGRVVQIDIDLDSWTRKERHVRLLFPSEY